MINLIFIIGVGVLTTPIIGYGIAAGQEKIEKRGIISSAFLFISIISNIVFMLIAISRIGELMAESKMVIKSELAFMIFKTIVGFPGWLLICIGFLSGLFASITNCEEINEDEN